MSDNDLPGVGYEAVPEIQITIQEPPMQAEETIAFKTSLPLLILAPVFALLVGVGAIIALWLRPKKDAEDVQEP